MSIEERIERMKEFFLRTLFTSKKLNIIDQEKIDLPIAFSEFNEITVLDGVNELVDKQLAGNVDDFYVFLLRPDVLADGLHQMCFAKADTSVNEKRIVRTGGRLGYC